MRNLILLIVVCFAGCQGQTTVSCPECGETAKASEHNLCDDCYAYAAFKNAEDEMVLEHFEGWGRDYELGLEVASEENKSVLLLFTGSDWCPPCKNLYNCVFASHEFLSQIPESVVLVVCDNPKNNSLVSDQERKQYKKLAEKFKVTGVPIMFLIDADGCPYHQVMGYGGTPAGEWVSELVSKIRQ